MNNIYFNIALSKKHLLYTKYFCVHLIYKIYKSSINTFRYFFLC